MNKRIQYLSLTACVALVAVSVSLLPGCKKETAQTTTTDSSKVTTTAGDTSHAMATKIDSAKTTGVVISGKALDGQKIYYNTSLGSKKVSCASCHSDGQPTTSDNRIRAGHTLVGVTSRTSTWNGMFKGADLKKYAYGGALCAAVYDRTNPDGEYTKGLTATQVDALNEYLTAISAGPNAMTSNLTIKWGTKPAFTQNDQLDEAAATAAAKAILRLPGDDKNGAALWARTCQYCHSMTDKKIGPPMNKAMSDVNNGAKTLRSGSDAMPFYGKDILTDQQCADIIAFVQKQLGK